MNMNFTAYDFVNLVAAAKAGLPLDYYTIVRDLGYPVDATPQMLMLLRLGIYTINEARERLGYKRVEGGDRFPVQVDFAGEGPERQDPLRGVVPPPAKQRDQGAA